MLPFSFSLCTCVYQGKAMWGYTEEVASCNPWRELSPYTDRTGTLILDFQSPELLEINSFSLSPVYVLFVCLFVFYGSLSWLWYQDFGFRYAEFERFIRYQYRNVKNAIKYTGVEFWGDICVRDSNLGVNSLLKVFKTMEVNMISKRMSVDREEEKTKNWTLRPSSIRKINGSRRSHQRREEKWLS